MTIPNYKSINLPNMCTTNPVIVLKANAKRLPTSEFSIIGIVGLRWLIRKT